MYIVSENSEGEEVIDLDAHTFSQINSEQFEHALIKATPDSVKLYRSPGKLTLEVDS